ncbi:MAG: T9SS type A sorting domain-containing protein [Saprospiraceae bacterium]|nr:T9SS type A sorting domain-containing protein [Saprospiraceae bacterium]MBK7738492.1 T9SS type A sorting domain-containing protein [Saprospiraceae bacterium]MBK7912936.1 T9SS type A sorting domain-containing protein [Saprospiraceae bacterium]
MNPVLDELRIQLQEGVGPWNLQLLNPKNECIQSHQGTNTTLNLNLENLSSGVYLLKIQTRKSTWIRRFVKI